MVKETMMESEHIRARAYKEAQIRSGSWDKPFSIPKPTKTKTRR